VPFLGRENQECVEARDLETLSAGVVLCKSLCKAWHAHRQLRNTRSDQTFSNFIFITQDLYQFDQKLELYTMYVFIFDDT
jgi:hypothetical protein